MNYLGRKFRPVSAGGGIRYGSMTGLCDSVGNLRFCYQHVSDEGR